MYVRVRWQEDGGGGGHSDREEVVGGGGYLGDEWGRIAAAAVVAVYK